MQYMYKEQFAQLQTCYQASGSRSVLVIEQAIIQQAAKAILVRVVLAEYVSDRKLNTIVAFCSVMYSNHYAALLS